MQHPPTRLAATSLVLVAAAIGLTACSSADRSPQQDIPAQVAQPSATAAGAGLGGVARAGSNPSGAQSGQGTAARPAGSGAAGAASQSCAAQQRWTTGADDGGLTMSTAAFSQTRAGRHECFERIVFDVDSPAAVGFSARYVPVVTADGSGHPVPVRGDAALQIVVRAPHADDGSLPGRGPISVGDPLLPYRTFAGWSTVTEVAYAGSFEGQTTIAVGVQERRPFRVWTMTAQGERQVVLDIAR